MPITASRDRHHSAGVGVLTYETFDDFVWDETIGMYSATVPGAARWYVHDPSHDHFEEPHVVVVFTLVTTPNGHAGYTYRTEACDCQECFPARDGLAVLDAHVRTIEVPVLDPDRVRETIERVKALLPVIEARRASRRTQYRTAWAHLRQSR